MLILRPRVQIPSTQHCYLHIFSPDDESCSGFLLPKTLIFYPLCFRVKIFSKYIGNCLHGISAGCIFELSKRSNEAAQKILSEMNISISQLEKNCKALATELEAQGYKVELDVFKSGSYSNSKGSYVEMIIERDQWNMFKVLANGYGAVNRGDVSTEKGWTLAKDQILASIK